MNIMHWGRVCSSIAIAILNQTRCLMHNGTSLVITEILQLKHLILLDKISQIVTGAVYLWFITPMTAKINGNAFRDFTDYTNNL